MRLFVKELDTTTTQQKITVGDENLYLYAIRPHLYRHNHPSGSLKLQILDASQVLLKESETLAISLLDIPAATNLDFFHGYIRFLVSYGLAANTDYYIRLVGSGYSYSDSAFVGWCNDFDLRKVTADYTPSTGLSAALDMEFWVKKRAIRGDS